MNSAQPLVSIVVPVCNAQEYLGYCINSLTSQTYPNLQIILIDDGSTDDSLQICRNYQALDRRINVIEQKNSGVSHARNQGVMLANGEFLLFVDSDDVAAQDMVEKLVHAALLYEKDLVCCGMLRLNFQKPEDERLHMNISNVMAEEIVMDGQAFRSHFMKLLAHTFLLEGPCAKLYRLDCWKKWNIKYPEDMSLGEDFMANMDYYEKCNGVAMFSEELYYYNFAPKDHSLSRMFRKKLFENQMRLMRRLKKFLVYSQDLPNKKQEENEFFNYTNSHTTKCIYEIAKENERLTLDEKKRAIATILNDSLAREAMQKCTWHIPGSEHLKWHFEQYDILGILKSFQNNELWQLPPCDPEEQYRREVAHIAGKGFLNKAVRKVIRIVACIVPYKRAEKLLKIEECIYWHGINYTLKHFNK